MSVPTSVLLVDDQPLLRTGFRMILETAPDMVVVGEAADGDAAVTQARALRPDVVLMDVRMPGTDGVEATRRIVAAGLPARVLVLTTFDVDAHVADALAAGASGFLLKDVAAAQLVDAVRVVARGDAVLAPQVTRRLLDRFATGAGARGDEGGGPAAHSLSAREAQVAALVADGLANSEIATRLHLSEATVKSHVSNILAKLDLRDRVQVVVWWYRRGPGREGTPGSAR